MAIRTLPDGSIEHYDAAGPETAPLPEGGNDWETPNHVTRGRLERHVDLQWLVGEVLKSQFVCSAAVTEAEYLAMVKRITTDLAIWLKEQP